MSPRPELDEFLKTTFEGYLLGDLRSMKNVPPPPPDEYGACGFSIVLVCCSGIELLGGLMSSKRFNDLEGKAHFTSFWRGTLYNSDSAKGTVAAAVYALARNGIAHTFATKPGITVSTQHAGTENHLAVTNGTLMIDAIQLANDLEHCYQTRVCPRLQVPEHRQQMQERLNEMYENAIGKTRANAAGLSRARPMKPEVYSTTTSGDTLYRTDITSISTFRG